MHQRQMSQKENAIKSKIRQYYCGLVYLSQIWLKLLV